MTDPERRFSWPEACEGAVSLTFDDAMRSQLELAVPMLDEMGLGGTFYVNPRGEAWRERLAPWREVALRGHEVGNHTVDHLCSRSFAWMTPKTLETTTLEEMEWQVAEGKRRLAELVPERPEMTFCYPCYQDYVGEGEARRSYVPVVARHHPAGRGRGEVPNHPLKTDLHYLGSFSAERMSGAEMVGYAERAATQGRWTLFTFHGIQEGGLSVNEADFRELLTHLARHRGRIWTGTVLEVAAYLREERSRLAV
jgi:peptidoglycan/xylan/chitin deacetylase (PgdA/CDA1 family)